MPETARCLGDALGRSGKGEAYPGAAIDRIEIETRGHGDPSLGEELPAEFLAVQCQARNIDIEVERSFGRCEAGQPGGTEGTDQQIAVGPVTVDKAVQLGSAAEHRKPCDLRERRRRNVEILS